MIQSAKPGTVLAVVVNYNGGDLVLQCVGSLLCQTHQPLEVVVVDNASTDGSSTSIRNKFPNIKLIENSRNTGCGAACNIGMKSQASDYIVLINNDAVLDQNCILEMVKAIELDPKYGSCASRVLLHDRRDRAEVCGLLIYRDGSSCARGRLGPANRYHQLEEVFCASGCCSLFRREMIDEIGTYDADFFAYGDDTDLGWRQQLAGWKCIYTPHAVAYHAHSHAAGSYSDFKGFHVERNRILICIKNFPLSWLLLSFFYSGYRYLYQWSLSTFKKQGALARYRERNSLLSGFAILAKAHWSAFKNFSLMWRKRREIEKIKRISNREMARLFERFGISTREMASYE
ncbi:MAG: hypothetical protein A3G87_06890 [Omnitrophica bacterium RIFCSPLOWO2_12_FULL_50_11]|nr:MAG: hypothetical protein A3G87_06890 [Omnitrophica bacterium RIFCSPLOWO2_12_FULL_50_11]